MRRKRRSRKIAGFLAFACIMAGAACIMLAFKEQGSSAGKFMREAVQSVIEEEVEKEKIPFQPDTIDENSLEQKFYYQQLASDEEKKIYRELLQGLRESKADIYVHCADPDQANEVFHSVLDDNPELFWCEGSASSTSYPATMSSEAYVITTPDYTYSGEEKAVRQEAIEAAVQECLSQIPQEYSEYERIKYVYEYLIDTVEYDLEAPDNQNIYSALVGKTSVCAGYAKSMQLLLERMGVFCTYVTGTATNSDGSTEIHAWNIVRCGDSYYFVDATWGDPVFQQEEGNPDERAMTYDYLCCSGRELFRTHELTEGFAYPECTSEELNYYRMNGMYYDVYDSERILNSMYDSIEAGESYTVFKFASDDLYWEAHDAVVYDLVKQGASYLGQWYGLREAWYSCEDDPGLDKITIYWRYG